MKFIVVQWVPENHKWGYGKAMIVIRSNHKKFTDGTRFDYRFMDIATSEGYVITILPGEEQ